jgi:glycine/D-amino acid oxidase-like deaminating enzyme
MSIDSLESAHFEHPAETPSPLHRPRYTLDPEHSRIAVIGGGCAGLVAARELGRHGYRRVELFEALDHIGGKSCTTEPAGNPYETGQLVFGARSREIFGIAREVGCVFASAPGTGFAVDAHGERQPLRAGASIRAWRDRLFAAAGVDPEAPPESSVRQISADLLTPISAWLRQHGLDAVPPEILASWTGFGYGYLSEQVPAWYLLRCMRAIDYNTTRTVSIEGGNQRLWDGLAQRLRQRHGYKLRCSAPVTRLLRTAAGVQVEVAGEALQPFDAVLLAVPPLAVAALLPEEERLPFLRFRYYDYRIAAFAGIGLAADVRSLNFIPRQSTPSPGRLLAIARAHRSPHTFITSQYGSRPGGAPLADDALDAQLLADLKDAGITVHRLLRRSRRRTYFPHLSAQDLRSGVLQQLESRQGRDRLFYLGSYLAFETLEHTARHAQAVVRAFFQAGRS